jgi:hypothetical protein
MLDLIGPLMIFILSLSKLDEVRIMFKNKTQNNTSVIFYFVLTIANITYVNLAWISGDLLLVIAQLCSTFASSILVVL